LAIVIGGTSAEQAVETAKLASAHYLDSLPTQGSELGHAFRDLDLEQKVLKLSQETGIGACQEAVSYQHSRQLSIPSTHLVSQQGLEHNGGQDVRQRVVDY
jgi:hypothetical protein